MNQNIKYASHNTKYADQNTKCAIPIENTKYTDQNTKLFTLFCGKVIFVLNLRTFLVNNFQMCWSTKIDKYQVYDPTYIMVLITI